MLALVSRLDALMMVGFATFSQLYDIDVQDCRTTKSRRKHIHLLFPISHLVSDLLTLTLEKSNKLGKGCQTWSQPVVSGISGYPSAPVLALW